MKRYFAASLVALLVSAALVQAQLDGPGTDVPRAPSHDVPLDHAAVVSR